MTTETQRNIESMFQSDFPTNKYSISFLTFVQFFCLLNECSLYHFVVWCELRGRMIAHTDRTNVNLGFSVTAWPTITFVKSLASSPELWILVVQSVDHFSLLAPSSQVVFVEWYEQEKDLLCYRKYSGKLLHPCHVSMTCCAASTAEILIIL